MSSIWPVGTNACLRHFWGTPPLSEGLQHLAVRFGMTDVAGVVPRDAWIKHLNNEDAFEQTHEPGCDCHRDDELEPYGHWTAQTLRSSIKDLMVNAIALTLIDVVQRSFICLKYLSSLTSEDVPYIVFSSSERHHKDISVVVSGRRERPKLVNVRRVGAECVLIEVQLACICLTRYSVRVW